MIIMKLIVACIRPEYLNSVVDALSERHAQGLTVAEVRGFGQEHDQAHPEHREYIGIQAMRLLRLEVPCQDGEVEGLLQAIYQVAHTNRQGAGRVFVLPMDDVLRLKTGERGAAALGPDSAKSR